VRAGADDDGQAAVELALVLPLLVLLLLAMVQVGLVIRDQVLLTHAAREAAREAAVDPAPPGIRRAALSAGPLEPGRLSVAMVAGPDEGRVGVQLRYASATDLPLVGPLLPDVEIQSRASMRKES
jgi:Flp pilus assembly pilin Flp